MYYCPHGGVINRRGQNRRDNITETGWLIFAFEVVTVWLYLFQIVTVIIFRNFAAMVGIIFAGVFLHLFAVTFIISWFEELVHLNIAGGICGWGGGELW